MPTVLVALVLPPISRVEVLSPQVLPLLECRCKLYAHLHTRVSAERASSQEPLTWIRDPAPRKLLRAPAGVRAPLRDVQPSGAQDVRVQAEEGQARAERRCSPAGACGVWVTGPQVQATSGKLTVR